MKLDQQLDAFRESYKSVRVTQYENFLVYRVNRGCGRSAAKDANELIELNKWNLVAIPTPFLENDCFTVQQGDVEM